MGRSTGKSRVIASQTRTIKDALGRPIPLEDALVWLDDDLIDRQAPDDWTHLRTAREVCFLLESGKVKRLSLDNDLNGDVEFGQGFQVIDFLEESWFSGNKFLFPEEGIEIHSANPSSRDKMRSALLNLERRGLKVKEDKSGPRPVFFVTRV